ncbi:uncharacterized protein FA14DRAFT_72347 [Meira miltonrushii]|uniref:Uncharacterized protein n=1 Tax=Meira miltonrushii TaxID=1280837 RepID=A0A316VA98_9BASI|nr:uncharacterized protein FA14DRAFT_72347 [Meira miltonrushii]PWN34426.1 hypothetical protein FA14DRAFT_72347 [Meira miltonrushii]
MWKSNQILFIIVICFLLMHSLLSQANYQRHFIKRAGELQRSGSSSSLDQPINSVNAIPNHVIDKNQVQRHRPAFGTSSWPPELPRSFHNKPFHLPKVKYEDHNSATPPKSTRSKSELGQSSEGWKPKQHSQKQSQMNQYEQSKEFHSAAQTMMQDNRWERAGKLALIAAGYGALKAYDKCKAIASHVHNQCNAAYGHVRQRFSRGARD